MLVEVHDRLQGGMRVPATRVVVYDNFDNPICVVFQLTGSQYLAAHAGSRNFQEILKMLGVNKTLIVDRIDPDDLTPLKA